MTNVISEVPIPTIEMIAVPMIKQRVEAQAFGSPNEARRLGAEAVDEHAEVLRRLAES